MEVDEDRAKQFAIHAAIRKWVCMEDGEWCHQVGLGKFYNMLTVTAPNVEWCTTFVLTMVKLEQFGASDQPAQRPAFLGLADRTPILWQPSLLDNLDLYDDNEWSEFDILTNSRTGNFTDNAIDVTARSFLMRLDGLLASIWFCVDPHMVDRVGEEVAVERATIIYAAHQGKKINWRNILVRSFERELNHLRLNRRDRTAIGPFLTWYTSTYRAKMYPPHKAGDSQRISELEETVAKLRAESRLSQDRTLEAIKTVIQISNEKEAQITRQLVAAQQRVEEVESRNARSEACLQRARGALARQSGRINALVVQLQELRRHLGS